MPLVPFGDKPHPHLSPGDFYSSLADGGLEAVPLPDIHGTRDLMLSRAIPAPQTPIRYRRDDGEHIFDFTAVPSLQARSDMQVGAILRGCFEIEDSISPRLTELSSPYSVTLDVDKSNKAAFLKLGYAKFIADVAVREFDPDRLAIDVGLNRVYAVEHPRLSDFTAMGANEEVLTQGSIIHYNPQGQDSCSSHPPGTMSLLTSANKVAYIRLQNGYTTVHINALDEWQKVPDHPLPGDTVNLRIHYQEADDQATFATTTADVEPFIALTSAGTKRQQLCDARRQSTNAFLESFPDLQERLDDTALHDHVHRFLSQHTYFSKIDPAIPLFDFNSDKTLTRQVVETIQAALPDFPEDFTPYLPAPFGPGRLG